MKATVKTTSTKKFQGVTRAGKRHRETPGRAIPSAPGHTAGKPGAFMKKVVALQFNSSALIAMIAAGLSVRELEDLRVSLDLPMEKLAATLGISKATIHRRKQSGKKFGLEESDRVVRFARLMGKAVEVFESEENARKWLNAPQVGLGGKVPLEYAGTEVGAREVEDLLGRIEFSVHS